MKTPAFSSREGHGPLSGVTVLDLSGYVAGPYGCTLLGDLGALVIKIEPPEGDNLRNYPSTLAEESRAFLGVNRNKHGIGLDLKHPDGLGVLRRMVEAADVLVHNFRPVRPAAARHRLRPDEGHQSAADLLRADGLRRYRSAQGPRRVRPGACRP